MTIRTQQSLSENLTANRNRLESEQTKSSRPPTPTPARSPCSSASRTGILAELD